MTSQALVDGLGQDIPVYSPQLKEAVVAASNGQLAIDDVEAAAGDLLRARQAYAGGFQEVAVNTAIAADVVSGMLNPIKGAYDTVGLVKAVPDIIDSLDTDVALEATKQMMDKAAENPEYSAVTAAMILATKGKSLKNSAARIPGRVASRINLSNKGMAHTLSRHMNASKANNKSQFIVSERGLRTLLSSKDTIQSPVKALETGNFSRTIKASRPIGNLAKKMGGTSTNTFTVITDRFGDLQTAFPGGI